MARRAHSSRVLARAFKPHSRALLLPLSLAKLVPELQAHLLRLPVGSRVTASGESFILTIPLEEYLLGLTFSGDEALLQCLCSTCGEGLAWYMVREDALSGAYGFGGNYVPLLHQGAGITRCLSCATANPKNLARINLPESAKLCKASASCGTSEGRERTEQLLRAVLPTLSLEEESLLATELKLQDVLTLLDGFLELWGKSRPYLKLWERRQGKGEQRTAGLELLGARR